MKLSLRSKLLIILIILSVGILSIYAFIVLNDFKEDKLAYIYDAVTFQSESVANQLQTELDFYRDEVIGYYSSYSPASKKFISSAKILFLKEKKIREFAVYAQEGSAYARITQMESYKGKYANFVNLDKFVDIAKNKIEEVGIMVAITHDKSDDWFLAIRVQEPGDNKKMILAVTIEDGKFVKFFKNSSWRDIYLIDDSGQIILGPTEDKKKSLTEGELRSAIQFVLTQIKGAYGTSEYTTANKNELLLSNFQLYGLPLRVVTLVPKSVVTESIRAILIKSIVFLGLLIFITIFISLLSSKNLTQSIQKLYAATLKISEGNFNINLKINSRDEVGSLASGFNKMAVEIERLMKETAEKTRMEQELKTAQIVQSTLFPNASFKGESYSIEAFYQPASECGGDWYYYCDSGNSVHIFMGDATGHGVPAALVTSSARAAVNVIEEFPNLSTSEIIGFLNRAICAAAKGKVLMTFFLATLDLKTGELTYCNASHEPPFLLPNYDAEPHLAKTNLKMLFGDVGARLGESTDSVYVESKIPLKKGERILVFTDGMTELMNAEGRMWGERRLSNSLVKGHNQKMSIKDFMVNIKDELEDFRKDHPLQDDLTYFMFEYLGP